MHSRLHAAVYSSAGLYTGLLPSVLKDSPFSAVYLLLYTRLKSSMAQAEQRLHWLTPAHSPSPEHLIAQMPVVQFFAAFTAGALATSLFQPTEVIKTRLQLSLVVDPATASTTAAHTATATAAAHRSGQTAAAAASSRAAASATAASIAGSSSTAAPAAIPSTSSSAVAPVIKSRHRVLEMTRRIYVGDGARGFFRGLAPRVIKRSLSSACGWMIFEQLVQFWSGTTGL